jgi:hypothetical protein
VPSFVNYKKGCTRLSAASDKVYQLLAHGRWFSPGTTVSSTTKAGRHDIAEILLKVALKHNKANQIKSIFRYNNHLGWRMGLSNLKRNNLNLLDNHSQIWLNLFSDFREHLYVKS